jgi:hypothetical protein
MDDSRLAESVRSARGGIPNGSICSACNAGAMRFTPESRTIANAKRMGSMPKGLRTTAHLDPM